MTSNLNEKDFYLERAVALQNLLISFSTGKGVNESDYQYLRDTLIGDSITKELLPNFIKANRSLSQLWHFIKSSFSSYKQRREFIWKEFGPLLEYLESKGGSTMGITYQTGEWKGTGGFGEVWECTRLSDNRIFAKKELLSDVDLDDQLRFKREVRILSMLDHPNIIKVIDTSLLKEPLYYVMPLYSSALDAQLPNLIGNGERIFKIFSAILDGMEYAHQQGIIHRDLKSDNVLMNDDNDVVISDFGHGRILDSKSARRTKTGISLGTPLYMAPEQFTDSKNADERSDIFSLGRILYELYTGPLNPSIQNTSTLSTGVAIIINRCTESDPNRRFQNLASLKSAWQNLFDISQRQSELEELQLLREQLSYAESFDVHEIERLLELVIKLQDDFDVFRDVFMDITSRVIAGMYEYNKVTVKHLLIKFIDNLNSQGWPFNYTDKIGNKCRGLYNLINNDEIRALLIDCVMKVGESHNRWHVLRIFGELILLPKKPDELIIISQNLGETDESTRKGVVQYINLSKIHPSLRKYFEFEDDEENGTSVYDSDLPF